MQQYLSGEKVILSLKKDAEAGFEFVLPEYLPGLSRIVKTCVSTEKVSVRNEENSIFLDLLLKIGIIYISDFGGKIKNAVFNAYCKKYALMLP